jgi:hypothetical protein
MAVVSRFDELRNKTGDQLVRLIHNTLDLGIREARHALKSSDTQASSEDHFLRAKRAYTEASSLIRLAGQVLEQERLHAGLNHLQDMLEGLLALRSRTGYGIPALARALWKARGCPEGSPEEDWFQAERALKSQAACVGG